MADSAALDPSLDPNATGGSFINPAYATPEQRAQLYKYANALMAPQPINNGWQGLASIARALVGGYEGHQADLAEQAAGRMNIAQATPGYGPAGSSPAAPPVAPAPIAGGSPTAPTLADAANIRVPAAFGGAPDSATAYAEPTAGPNVNTRDLTQRFADRAQDLQQDAADAGIPTQMVSGFRDNALQAKLYANYQARLAGKPLPYPQVGQGGMAAAPGQSMHNSGNAADITTNNPAQQPALNALASEPWRGITPGLSFGDPDHYQSAGAGSPGIPPAHAALAAALLGGRGGGAPGVQTAQNLPFTPSQLGYMLGSPNANDDMREVAARAAIPGTVTDATGNMRPVYQNSEVGPSIAGLGVPGPVIGGVAPSFIGGTPGAPTQTVANPAFAGVNRGNNAGPTATPNLVGPGSLAGDVATQQGMTAAGIEAQKAKSAAAQQRYQQTQTAGPALMTQAYPLRQVQAILDKNGGNIPTGEGAERVQGAASIVNMVATALGHPLTNEDSRLTSMELLHKYGTQVAASQAEALGLPHTNMGQETATGVAPGTGLSQPADTHLVDNLIRLNALAQKKNQFEHDYYLHNQGRPDAYDNFTQDWQNEISGAKAIPLSKFGRDVIMKNGKPGVWVPSTDPSGFSLFPKDDPAFNVSAMTPGAR